MLNYPEPAKIMSRHLAARMQQIQPFQVMDLLARARSLEAGGRSIVHMEIGEPDFPTPPAIIEAGRRALTAGCTHYTPAVGLFALREAIAAFYASRYGLEVSPKRIVITPGASGALQLALGVMVDPGDEVLLADPGYPCNRNFVHLFEGRPRAVEVGPRTAYQLTADLLRSHWSDGSRIAMVASPSNPTGTVIPAQELREIVEVVRGLDGRLIVDEIYHGLTYDSEVDTALRFGDDVFVINSFSKYFGMTGWRLGWLVAPLDSVEPVDRLAQNIFLAASTPAQHAALAAFEPETLTALDERREIFRRRRDFLLPALKGLGFEIPVTPQGAFYIYAGCGHMTDDSHKWSRELLERAGVAVTPGIDFGVNRAATQLRFAYTTSLEQLEEGVRRIERHLAAGG
jgi:aspartate/methionine/tyrosine aminotransferase